MSKVSGKDEIPFYEKKSSYTKAGIMSLAGCILMLAATFLYWKNMYVRTTETTYTGVTFWGVIKQSVKSMLARNSDGGIEKFVFSIHGLIPIILMTIYLVVLLFLFMAGVNDNIRRVDFFVKKKKRIRLGALVILIILVVLFVFTQKYKDSYGQVEELYKRMSSIIEDSKVRNQVGADHMVSYLFIGPGFISFCAGILLYFASIIFNFILVTLNEDDEVETDKTENAEEAESADKAEGFSETEGADKAEGSEEAESIEKS